MDTSRSQHSVSFAPPHPWTASKYAHQTPDGHPPERAARTPIAHSRQKRRKKNQSKTKYPTISVEHTTSRSIPPSTTPPPSASTPYTWLTWIEDLPEDFLPNEDEEINIVDNDMQVQMPPIKITSTPPVSLPVAPMEMEMALQGDDNITTANNTEIDALRKGDDDDSMMDTYIKPEL